MFKHFGTTPVKFEFLLEVKSVVFPDMEDAFDGTESVCVGYERKGHSTVITADRPVTFDQNDQLAAFFKEKMKIGATLYKENKTGLFQEKFGQLNVLQRKKGSLGQLNTKEAFKTLGVAMLPLHEIAQTHGNNFEDRALRLQWCMSERARLIVSAEIISEGDNKQTSNSANNSNKLLSIDDNDSVASFNMHHSSTINNAPVLNTNTNINNNSNTASNGNKPSSLFGSQFSSTNDNNNNNNVTLLKKRIEELELALLNSAEVVENERQKAKEAIAKATAAEDQYQQKSTLLGADVSSSAQMKQLQQELLVARDSNASLHDTIAKYVAESDKLRDNLIATHDELEKTQQEKQRVEKALREKNDECETLLAELIKAKMSVGDLSTELDELKRTLKLTASSKPPQRKPATEGQPPQPAPPSATSSNPNNANRRASAPQNAPSVNAMPPPVTRRASVNPDNGHNVHSNVNVNNNNSNNVNNNVTAVNRRTSDPSRDPPVYNNNAMNANNNAANSNNNVPPQSMRTPQRSLNDPNAMNNNNSGGSALMMRGFGGGSSSSNPTNNYNNNNNNNTNMNSFNNNNNNSNSSYNMTSSSQNNNNYNNNYNNNNNFNNSSSSNYNPNNATPMNNTAASSSSSSFANNVNNNNNVSTYNSSNNYNNNVPNTSNNSNSSNNNGNVLLDGLGSLRRGFDNVSSTLMSNTPGTGAKRPPPSRPVF